jgi:hypothetical protein
MNWEYTIEVGGYENDDILPKLNELGNEGWEALTMTANDAEGDTAYTVLLRRAKQAA